MLNELRYLTLFEVLTFYIHIYNYPNETGKQRRESKQRICKIHRNTRITKRPEHCIFPTEDQQAC